MSAVDAGGTATVLVHDRPVRVVLLALDERVEEGDWLLVHSGIALARIDEQEALARHHLMNQAGEQG